MRLDHRAAVAAPGLESPGYRGRRVAAAAKLHFAAFVCVRCAAHEDAGRASGSQDGAARDGEDFGGVKFGRSLGGGSVFQATPGIFQGFMAAK
jgi:hypothetical protein